MWNERCRGEIFLGRTPRNLLASNLEINLLETLKRLKWVQNR